jgi:hypothetical protein
MSVDGFNEDNHAMEFIGLRRISYEILTQSLSLRFIYHVYIISLLLLRSTYTLISLAEARF